MTDILSKIKQKRGPFEKISSYIPLYHGYKEKELRRESDKILREHVYRILNDVKTNAKKIQTTLIKANKMDVAKNVDELITKLDTISQKINRAESGYAGFWDVTKIKESELDKIYEIDSEIATIADELKIGINEFEKSKEEEYDTNLEKIIQKIESFDSKFNQRTDQLKGFDEK